MALKRKIFAVSDVHGCASLLKKALFNAGFDAENEEHLLVVCGDVFDRGEENLEVLRFLERVERKVFVRGNHEDLLCDLLNRGTYTMREVINGTINTVQEFFSRRALMDGQGFLDLSGQSSVLRRLDEFFAESVNFFETERFIFCHGWLPTEHTAQGVRVRADFRTARDSDWCRARWTHFSEMEKAGAVLMGKTIVCGHEPVPAVYPDHCGIYHGAGFTAIDTGAYFTGNLSVFVTEDNLLEN